jgi:hypothetical protein
MKNLCGESIHVVVVLLAIDGLFPERDPDVGVAAPLGVQLRSVTRAGFVGPRRRIWRTRHPVSCPDHSLTEQRPRRHSFPTASARLALTRCDTNPVSTQTAESRNIARRLPWPLGNAKSGMFQAPIICGGHMVLSNKYEVPIRTGLVSIAYVPSLTATAPSLLPAYFASSRDQVKT